MSEKKDRCSTKVGITFGAFDLLHAGHVLMLEEAKDVCDHLIVAVQSDPSVDRPSKNKPIQSYEERLIQVRALRCVDDVVLYDTEDDLIQVLLKLKPDVRIIGADHKGKKFTGWELPIEIYFNSRSHSYSSSELRQRIYQAEKSKQIL